MTHIETTPGQWIARPKPDSLYWEVGIAGKPQVLAEVYNHNGAEGNARLMAAAHSMRDLLQALAQWDHLAVAGDGPYWRGRIDTILAELEGANAGGK